MVGVCGIYFNFIWFYFNWGCYVWFVYIENYSEIYDGCDDFFSGVYVIECFFF